MTFTCRQLGVGPTLVSRWYATARRIMARYAIWRHSQIVFGRRGSLTTDVEADESKFFGWKERTQGIDGEVRTTYYWFVWLGVVQRGNTETLWMHPVGITHSEGEPRIPPLKKELWWDICFRIFDKLSNIVLITDGAEAYRKFAGFLPVGIVEHHWVNHSRKTAG